MKHFFVLLSMCALSAQPVMAKPVWRGVDLSYVNELEDCGASYRVNGVDTDPYDAFAQAGANIVRLRLWHSPNWTDYSNLRDAKKSIARAKANGMQVLLDFHYSDDWADPGKQIKPKAWTDTLSTDELAKKLYDYTANTLTELHAEGLLPEHVQIGNETNSEILMSEKVKEGAVIDWKRNAKLLNSGISAVRDVSESTGEDISIMLHIAQPENVEKWIEDGARAGLLDFDIIGFSYYTKWSALPPDMIDRAVAILRQKYGKDVVVVETAYPWTLRGNDSAHNLIGEADLVSPYPATEKGQRSYLIDLFKSVIRAGGLGIVYWEPAWVSSRCKTRWGKGSHWENAALFDYKNGNLLPGADYLGYDYSNEIQVAKSSSKK